MGYELKNKWDAWVKCGCLASEMESAALYIAGSCLRVRVGTVLFGDGHQERAEENLPNPVAHDVEAPIRTAIEALKTLIREDKKQD